MVWPVYPEPEGQEGVGRYLPDLKPLAEPTVELEVDVPAATPEHLAALRKRMEDQLGRSDLSDWDKRSWGRTSLTPATLPWPRWPGS